MRRTSTSTHSTATVARTSPMVARIVRTGTGGGRLGGRSGPGGRRRRGRLTRRAMPTAAGHRMRSQPGASGRGAAGTASSGEPVQATASTSLTCTPRALATCSCVQPASSAARSAETRARLASSEKCSQTARLLRASRSSRASRAASGSCVQFMASESDAQALPLRGVADLRCRHGPLLDAAPHRGPRPRDAVLADLPAARAAGVPLGRHAGARARPLPHLRGAGCGGAARPHG